MAEGFEGQAEGVGRCFPGLCVPVPAQSVPRNGSLLVSE